MFGDDGKSAAYAQTAARKLSSAMMNDDAETARAGRFENPILAARR